MLFQLDNCLCCNSSDLELVLNLGSQPLANNYTKKPQEQESFPLALNVCKNCTHLQLTHSVDRSVIFTDYPYVSGTTKTLQEEFATLAQILTEKHGVGTVLDIACNDGSQLDAFKRLGWHTIGIDPAENLYKISSAKHTIYCDFLNDSHRSIKTDIIVAQNVLAHTPYPYNFLDICSDIAPVAYVQTSQANMVKNGEFDTIYHEHISFFSEKSMMALLSRTPYKLASVSFRPVHGTSFLFELSTNTRESQINDTMSIDDIYTFAEKAKTVISELKSVLVSHKESGRKLVGYGAAAKGMTVLNAIGVPLDYIVDDNPMKWDLFTPGLNIPIISPSVLTEEKSPITLIPLAWNFFDEISEKVASLFSGDMVTVKYFPEMFIK